MVMLVIPLILALFGGIPKVKETDWGIANKKGAVVIYFTGTIDTDTVATMMQNMTTAASSSAKAIVLEIDSHGGEVDAGERLAKFIEQFPLPVICIADRMAHSMAFYILQSCDRRVMTKRAELLAHSPWQEGGRTVAEHERLAKSLQITSDGMAEHEARRMNISVKEFKRRIWHQDWRMGWEEALKVGAVDEVVDTTLNYMKSL